LTIELSTKSQIPVLKQKEREEDGPFKKKVVNPNSDLRFCPLVLKDVSYSNNKKFQES
jgi:hypothetical protein